MAESARSVEDLCTQWLEGLPVNGKYDESKPKKASMTSSDTSSYFTDSIDKFPTSTSKWNINCLESLGIFYNQTYHDSPHDILSMIFEETGAFRTLSDEQTSITSETKNSMTFSFPKSEIAVLDKKIISKNGVETFFPEIEEDIDKCKSEVIKEFLVSCQMMLSCRVEHFYDFQKTGDPDDMYVSMVERFSRLCQLLPVPGSVKTSAMTLQEVSVSSRADLVMIPEKYRLSAFSASGRPKAVSSINVEVKNSHQCSTRKEIENSSRCARSSVEANEKKDCYDPPQIYSRVHTDILAQHGGELLIGTPLYDSTLSRNTDHLYLPGMVIIRSEVIFTFLKIDKQHVQQLKRQDNITFTATIYYSKPKDLLRKEDRDLLIDAFSRLNNI